MIVLFRFDSKIGALKCLVTMLCSIAPTNLLAAVNQRKNDHNSQEAVVERCCSCERDGGGAPDKRAMSFSSSRNLRCSNKSQMLRVRAADARIHIHSPQSLRQIVTRLLFLLFLG